MSDNGLQPANAEHLASDPARRSRQFPKIIYLPLVFLLFCICGIVVFPLLRGQKLRLLILRNQIEASAAPGEPVLLDDWLLNRSLLWKGSPALRCQLVYIKKGRIPPELLASRQEFVISVPDGDPLLSQLRDRGFTLMPNTSQAAWIAGGKGFHTPGRKVFRIYFSVAVSPVTVSKP